MPTRDQPMILKDFAGLNLRDGGDKILSNQFLKLKNWYPYSKGVFYKRSGTTSDTSLASIGMCSAIKDVYRFYSPFNERMTLMYCEPDGTAAPIATGPIESTVTPMATITETTGGDIFDGGAVSSVSVYTSWVGKGMETKAAYQGAIVLSSNAKAVLVTSAAFPTGVSSMNVFVTVVGIAATQTYVGSINTSGGTLTFGSFIGPAAAGDDQPPAIFKIGDTGSGNLKRGRYYVACAWLADSNLIGLSNVPIAEPATGATVGEYQVFEVLADGGSITVCGRANTFSPDGAKWLLFFVGTQAPTEAPMTFIGIRKSKTGAVPTSKSDSVCITISDLPESNCNAQSAVMPTTDATKDGPWFLTRPIVTTTLGGPTARPAFLVKKDSGGTLKEVAFSRTAYDDSVYLTIDPLNVRTVTVSSLNKRETLNRKAWISESATNVSMNSFMGHCYIANGKNILIQTDGYAMCEVSEKPGTMQPGFPTIVLPFKNQLCVLTYQYSNQIFGSNAQEPRNWASGGTGTALKFVTVGDPFGDGMKSLGIFSFTSGTEGPKSYLMAMKKSSSWIISQIPDLTSVVPGSMEQISGRVGCIAYRSCVQTPIGFVFVGNDGDIYLSRGSGDPYRLGGTVRSLLSHLTSDDSLMVKCSATYHEGFYKLSYPSSSTSTGNDAQLWGDFRTEPGIPITWSGPHTGISVGPQIVYVGENDNSSRFGVKADGSALVKLDDPSTFQDLGTDISSELNTKIFRFNAEMHFKRLMSVILDAYYDSQYAHTLLWEALMDEQYTQYEQILSAGTAIWDTSAFDAASWGSAMNSYIPWFIGPNPLVGRTLQFKLTHTGNAQFILAAIGSTIQPERRQIV